MITASRRRARLTGLVLFVALSGCAQVANPSNAPLDPAGSMVSTDVELVGAAVPCTGLTGQRLPSPSYLPGAPSIERDGDQFALTLTVVAPTGDGSCRALAGAIVEIWHNGDQPGYVPDRWRTALRSDATGTVRYLTARPVRGEGAPHFHARVTATSGAVSYEDNWTIAVQPDTASELTRTVLLTVLLAAEAAPFVPATTPATPGV